MGYFSSGYETHPELRRRIELTVGCRDCDPLPRVPNAGHIDLVGDDYVQVMHNGVRVLAGGYYGKWMAEIIERLNGVHEPQEELAFHHAIERLADQTDQAWIVELGAFWSFYTLWALQRIPDSNAVLVEPDPNNLAVGRKNFELNQRLGTFVQAAVGAEAKPPMPFRCESDGVERDVATVSLSSLLTDCSIPRIDLLLIDVQGAEFDFLVGGRDYLQQHVRFVFVSTHHHSISGDPLTHQKTLNLLMDLGAHIIAEHSVGESFSGDGLIAASFDQRDRDMHASITYGREGHTLFPNPLVDLAAAQEFNQALQARQAALDLEKDAVEREKRELILQNDRLLAEIEAAKTASDRLSATRTFRVHQAVSRNAILTKVAKTLRLIRSS